MRKWGLKCEICGRKFSKHEGLKNHLKEHRGAELR
jgi:hypothetical protein